MLCDANGRWLKRLGIAAIAAIGLGVASLSPTPANAQVYYPHYYYSPPPPPAYYYPKHPTYKASYRRCGPGWHFVHGHWNRWGRWVAPQCRPNW